MATIKETTIGVWRGMDRGLRIAAVGAALLAVAATVWGSYVLLHEDYGTLFAQLSDTDAASIVDALKRQKIPYRLSDNGSTISVPANRVNDTRLGLMSSNVPLSGGIGFELFDKQGLGATEQSQRVSYQRALQGELVRTISSLENVKQVRVHLVLPESSLFKRDRQEATAAVTVTMKPGNTLDKQQIIGVQRLVAASVAGLDPAHVVITDQRGVTLSAADANSGSVVGVEARLDIQRQIEAHIAQKISRLLDNAYGSGQAIISVAVAISFDAIKRTTQDLLPVHGTGEGGVVRKRQVTSGTIAGDSTGVAQYDTALDSRRTNSTTEIEYEYGRRVEEVIASPGAIKRLTIGVIVPPRLGEDQQRRIRELVEVAAGIDVARGDIVSVQSLDQPSANGAQATQGDEPVLLGDPSGPPKTGNVDAGAFWAAAAPLTSIPMVVLVALLVVAVLAFVLVRFGRARSLTDRQREQLLQDIRRTLGDERATPMQVKR
jgi:flagellar M-ring protein FliF